MKNELILELFNTDKEIHDYVCRYAISNNVTPEEAMEHMIVKITIAWMIKEHNIPIPTIYTVKK